MKKTLNFLAVICLIAVIVISCEKKITIPVIQTSAASSVTTSGAYGTATIISNGGSEITVKGICWGLTTGPTVYGSNTQYGSGSLPFSWSISGLSPGTTYYVCAYATNSAGTAYGNEITFTTDAVTATLSTTSVSSITSTSAVSGGNISTDGGSSVTARGVCWGTNQNPTVDGSKTTDGTGAGQFTSTITGLTPGITYYVRAYAINNKGTTYGQEISFRTLTSAPIVTTADVTAITATTAISGGSVTDDGGVSLSAKGLCWSTNQNPTISDFTTVNANYAVLGSNPFVQDNLIGAGAPGPSFVSSMTSLAPGTTYYVRAYATNSMGTSYGSQKSFTTLITVPEVTTSAVSSITSSSALGGGNVTSNGGSSITARGVCWSTSANPTIADSKTTNNTGTGSYESSIKGLAPNTTYYVRAYAINTAGTAYGNQVTFTSEAEIPTVITSAPSYVASSSAMGGGNVTSSGGLSITARGVCWSTSSNPTIANSKTANGTGIGSFVSSITGLLPNTTYYVRAYATNSKGTSYGNQINIKTSEVVSDIESNNYSTVIIGDQTWFQENLRTTKYNDGSIITNITGSFEWWSNTEIPAYCWYGNDSYYASPYGAFYNYYAVKTGKLCPTGWHVATDQDWTYIIDFLGGYAIAGQKMKISGTAYWHTPNIATNESGFSAYPSGYRELWSYGGAFMEFGRGAYFWAFSTTGNWYRDLGFDRPGIIRQATTSQLAGLSVRCVKNIEN